MTQPPAVLLIEDTEADIFLVRKAFEAARFECRLTSLRDGASALEYLGSAAAEQPDLILLDLNLPKVDGIEVLQAIHKSGRRTPVVVLTSSESPRDIARLRELGVERHIVKSSRLSEFLSLGRIVAEILHHAAARPPANSRSASSR
jgi:CheY-like chemotaxis protein